MSTVLAQAAAQAVVQGLGSIGPFAVPSGAFGIALVIERAGLPAVAGLLSVMCMASYDGGQMFIPLGGGGIDGGDLTFKGSPVTQSMLSFAWKSAPTHVRLDVNAAQAFSTGFTVEAL